MNRSSVLNIVVWGVFSAVCIAGCAAPSASSAPAAASSAPAAAQAVRQTAARGNTFTDPRDNQVYPFVRVGSLDWFAKNLNHQTDGSGCGSDDGSDCEKFGRLYSWDAAMSACPAGWRLPSDADWDNLMTAVGGVYAEVYYDEFFNEASDEELEEEKELSGELPNADRIWRNAGKTLRSNSTEEGICWRTETPSYMIDGHDDDNDENGDDLVLQCHPGTDDFGFSALPGGMGSGVDYFRGRVNTHASWWSATADDAGNAGFRYIPIYSRPAGGASAFYTMYFVGTADDVWIGNVEKDQFNPHVFNILSVRCVRD